MNGRPKVKDFARDMLRVAIDSKKFRGIKLRRIPEGFAVEMLVGVSGGTIHPPKGEPSEVERIAPRILAWERTEDLIFDALREAAILSGHWIRQHDEPSAHQLTSGEIFRIKEIHGETLEWENVTDQRLFWLGWIKTDGARVRVDNEALDMLFDSHGDVRDVYRRDRNTTPIGTGALR